MLKAVSVFFTLFISLLPSLAVAQDQGYPDSWQFNITPGVSPIKQEMYEFHNMLLVVTTGIVLVVTALLAWVIVKYRRTDARKPAAFAHNTLVEVAWTIIPVIILIVIAIPSIRILYMEDRVPVPELTLKVTGYQWYWGYEYMDYEGLEFLSYPIADEDIDAEAGQKRLLSTDNPVVVPVNTNIQILTTAGDVIHSFALPSAGVKKDAVPGRLNETWMRITRPGTYFGQCSEICGTGHAYMPIEIKAVPRAEFDAWTAEMGGTLRTTTIETDEAAATQTSEGDALDSDAAQAEAIEEAVEAEVEEDLRDDDLGNDSDDPVQNSETEEPDSVQNKRNNPKVDSENVSNPGQ